MRGDAQPLRQLFHLAKPFCFGHRVRRHVAHRDIAALGDQLPRQLAAHARAAPGDDSDLSGKILHGAPSFANFSWPSRAREKCSIYTPPVKLMSRWRDT